MNDQAIIRRRTCLGLALGIAADAALPRASDAAGFIDETGPGGTYKTICSFDRHLGKTPSGVMCASDGLVYGVTAEGGAQGRGTLYCVDTRRRIHVLHTFAGSPDDGRLASAPPTEGDDGALYGLVTQGGPVDRGVAYRLGRDGRWDILHTFGETLEEGYWSWGSLLLASDGQFYGTTSTGGLYGGGVVFRMGKDGTVTPLWQLGEGHGPADPVSSLIEGADGRLYGASAGGGSGYSGAIFTLAKDGSDPRVLHSFGSAGGSYPGAIVQGQDGYLYGTTLYGGPKEGGVAYRMATDGSAYVPLHVFGGRMDGSYPSSPLLEIEPGVFLGTTDRDSASLFDGALFALTADGRFQSMRRFGRRSPHGVPDGKAPRGPLCRLPSGELVGTCTSGGAADGGTLWLAREPEGGWGSGLQT